MGENTKIEWTDHTANLWWGCIKVHKGCDNCYAEYLSDVRYKKNLWGPGTRRQAIKSVWGNLLTWQAKAAAAGELRTVFVGSMMDIFEVSKPLVNHKGEKIAGSTGDLRKRLFEEIVPNCPNLIFLLLTKRPKLINRLIPKSWRKSPPENVWYGTSVVDQDTAGRLIPELAKVNGRIFISVEPQLDYIDLEAVWEYNAFLDHLLIYIADWVIVGGESGSKRRSFDPDWARSIREVCKEHDVPFFMKQWDKVKAIPDDLLIREYPDFKN